MQDGRQEAAPTGASQAEDFSSYRMLLFRRAMLKSSCCIPIWRVSDSVPASLSLSYLAEHGSVHGAELADFYEFASGGRLLACSTRSPARTL